MELAREAMKAAKERKARSQMNLLDGLEEDGETKSSSNEFKNQELFQYLKELTSSSRKGGRRCSTYAKVKDALIEKFGESVFKADKSQVQSIFEPEVRDPHLRYHRQGRGRGSGIVHYRNIRQQTYRTDLSSRR